MPSRASNAQNGRAFAKLIVLSADRSSMGFAARSWRGSDFPSCGAGARQAGCSLIPAVWIRHQMAAHHMREPFRFALHHLRSGCCHGSDDLHHAVPVDPQVVVEEAGGGSVIVRAPLASTIDRI